MAPLDLYTKGVKAWFPDETEAWVSRTLVSAQVDGSNVLMSFTGDDDGQTHEYSTTLQEIEKSNGQNLPPLRNPPRLESTDDLTNLSYLNEPAVLHTVHTRYDQRQIYTYSGIVLIAINPFARVALYEPEIVQLYSGKRRGELEPHLFAIAEDAYRNMTRGGGNQTIVVSGESGAGKTVSAKFIMRYFATADDQEKTGRKKSIRHDQSALSGAAVGPTSGTAMSEVEEQILATNPIMEAFGNAKTTRNDNSSRFGKYIEIQFDDHANIVGAKIRTYLLERSRLIYQPELERNYHIFYQLCAGAPPSERHEFDLGDYAKFHYLNQSGTGVIPNVDDTQEFEVTMRSLSTVGIAVHVQWQIFRILAALLHIGNISITGSGMAIVAEDDQGLLTASKLLGIDAMEFRKWIVRKQLITRNRSGQEKIVTNLTPVQATVVKDSVAKYVYANLFDWLVSVINESLACTTEGVVANFIGVLDIYGFEHFKKNSFEQFCINYANEKLQQQFNQHVFKLIQEEYVQEQIDWTFIEFSDNQPCIDMIEGKLGILSLLDEESRLPSGSDAGWTTKLYQHFDTPKYKNFFKKPRFSNEAFTVVHYAHEVQYESESFLDKNKDTVPDEHLALLQSTEFAFLKDVLDAAAATAPPTPEANKRMSMIARKPTLGAIFKSSLINLMDTISKTDTHYIRCIKPNEGKEAWVFEPNMVVAQLRACGVLETIRISCAGYPSKWTYEEFADRYYMLVESKYWDGDNRLDVKELCKVILNATITEKDNYQVGLTKIFFRAGQLAYMENLRSNKMNACATIISKNIQRFVQRKRYLRLRKAILAVQVAARTRLAMRKVQAMREHAAALKIQSCYKGYAQRKRYLKQVQFVRALQDATRAYFARKQFRFLRHDWAAMVLQRNFRRFSARKQYLAQREQIVRIQTCIRRRRARKLLQEYKVEARSVSHFKDISYKLENKVVELTQNLVQQKDEKKILADKASALERQISSWSEKYEKLERKTKELETKLMAPTVSQSQWDGLHADHTRLQSDHSSALEKIKAYEDEIARLKEDIGSRNIEISRLQESHAVSDAHEVADLKKEIASLKSQLSQMHAHPPPRRQGSTSTANGTLAPATANSTRSNDVSAPTSPRDFEQQMKIPTFLPKAKRRYSVEGGKDKTRPKTVIEAISHAHPGIRSPRPGSLDQYNNIVTNNLKIVEELGDPEEEMQKILENEDELHEEIMQGLIATLKIPLPSLQNPPQRREIFFPAQMINVVLTQMWKFGYIQESERLLFNIMDAIQKQCLSFQGDEAIVPCAFWLSNVHELLSLICITERGLEPEIMSMNGRRAVGWHDFEKLVSTIKYEMQCLEDNIFHAWMKEMKKKLSKMIIPSVVESQSLPGFVTSDSGRFLNKLLSGTHPAYSMDDLLGILNKVWRSMKCYFIEQSVVRQVLTELLKLIGVTSFNDLLMRRNFCSWKRAMQIQYNITRIEEWCKSHDIPEGTLQLEHLMQATKLLQLKKASMNDIEIIYDVCWMLTPTQIQKLIAQYFVADYENPISPEILKMVASRVVSGDKNDILLLDTLPLDDTTNPFEVPLPRELDVDKYLPAWLDLQSLRKLGYLTEVEAKTEQEA